MPALGECGLQRWVRPGHLQTVGGGISGGERERLDLLPACLSLLGLLQQSALGGSPGLAV